ncbi:FAD-dependent oxidoreductase, partial [Kluyvera cryocrescens]
RPEPDDELAGIVRDALSAWFPEHHFGGFETVGIDRIEFAQFEQPPGFRSAVPTVDSPDGPVFVAGDYTEWSSIQGALKSGRRA